MESKFNLQTLLLSFDWLWFCHVLILCSDTLHELPSLKEEGYYAFKKKKKS